jgi:hypothetical protein
MYHVQHNILKYTNIVKWPNVANKHMNDLTYTVIFKNTIYGY